jgi:hypothetical protein
MATETRVEAKSDFIRIERCSIPTWPGKSEVRYFVDLATRMPDGTVSTGNLTNWLDHSKALESARSYGLIIEDKTVRA